MSHAGHDVGAYVRGAPTSGRILVRHADLLRAYADGAYPDDGEAYLSHYCYGLEMRRHYAAHRQSVAGYTGPCCCRWLMIDIDRGDLTAALADARRLAATIADRYGDPPVVYYSGSKGFHVGVELSHRPPPSVGFHRTAKTYAEGLAALAGVTIDTSIYDVAHIIRLPNTRHPKSGLFKRRIDADALYCLSIDAIRDLAKHPSGDGLPTITTAPSRLADDWAAAEQRASAAASARQEIRRDHGAMPDKRAPRYLMEFFRFGVGQGERHQTLFRCAAWMTEMGSPPSLVLAMLTEPGLDVGLSPADVERQIRCGISHAVKQRAAADPMPDPADVDAYERWAIRHESDPLPPGATEFEFGAATQSEGGTR